MFANSACRTDHCHENTRLQISNATFIILSWKSKLVELSHMQQNAPDTSCSTAHLFLGYLSNLATFSIYSGNGINTTSPWLLVTSLPPLCHFLFILDLNNMKLTLKAVGSYLKSVKSRRRVLTTTWIMTLWARVTIWAREEIIDYAKLQSLLTQSSPNADDSHVLCLCMLFTLTVIHKHTYVLYLHPTCVAVKEDT